MISQEENHSSESLTNLNFLNLWIRTKSPLKDWQSLECIQSCVKAKFGLGRHIPIHFRMELDIAEETQISNEFKDKTSILNQNPPILKYNYAKIGLEYA